MDVFTKAHVPSNQLNRWVKCFPVFQDIRFDQHLFFSLADNKTLQVQLLWWCSKGSVLCQRSKHSVRVVPLLLTVPLLSYAENQCDVSSGRAEAALPVNEVVPVKRAEECVRWTECRGGTGRGGRGPAAADVREEVDLTFGYARLHSLCSLPVLLLK